MATIVHPGGKVSGALAVPGRTPAPAVLLIHEWWGLNDHIKAKAAEFANAGFLAYAIDLFTGSVATTREQAAAQTGALDPVTATQALTAAVAWLCAHPQGNGKVATVGWCFGGGWSLNAALATPVDATVVYYGRVNKSATLRCTGTKRITLSPIPPVFVTIRTMPSALGSGRWLSWRGILVEGARQRQANRALRSSYT